MGAAEFETGRRFYPRRTSGWPSTPRSRRGRPAPARDGAHDRRARGRRPRRVLPRARSPMRSPRPCRNPVATSHPPTSPRTRASGPSRSSGSYRDLDVAELPPPTQGVAALEALRILDGCTIPASGAVPRARPDRSGEARARRPRRVRHGPVAHAVRTRAAAHRRVDRRAPRPARPRARERPRHRTGPSAAAPRTCARRTPTGCSSASSSRTSCSFGSGVHVPEWGINLNNRGVVVLARRDRGQRVRAVEAADAHADPRDGPARREARGWCSAAWAATRRSQVHVQLLTHVLDGMDPGEALAAPRWRVDPGRWRVHARVALRPAVARRAPGPRAPRRGPLRTGYDAAWATRTRSCRAHGGYVAASDPRSEGAALGL